MGYFISKMKNTMWRTCFILFCFLLTVFCGNYTYYDGFAYTNGNRTIQTVSAINQNLTNSTINFCVCQCLLTNGCSAFNLYSANSTCVLINDPTITEDDVVFNNMSKLLLVTAI